LLEDKYFSPSSESISDLAFNTESSYPSTAHRARSRLSFSGASVVTLISKLRVAPQSAQYAVRLANHKFLVDKTNPPRMNDVRKRRLRLPATKTSTTPQSEALCVGGSLSLHEGVPSGNAQPPDPNMIINVNAQTVMDVETVKV
jgi:hypothetical protein